MILDCNTLKQQIDSIISGSTKNHIGFDLESYQIPLKIMVRVKPSASDPLIPIVTLAPHHFFFYPTNPHIHSPQPSHLKNKKKNLSAGQEKENRLVWELAGDEPTE